MIDKRGIIWLTIAVVLLALNAGCSITQEYLVTVENDTYYAVVVLTIDNMQTEVRPQSIGELYVDEGNYEYKVIVGDVYETGEIGIFRGRTLVVRFDPYDFNYRVEWR